MLKHLPLAAIFLTAPLLAAAPPFAGRHYRGTGDPEYLRDLETAARMFQPDPVLQNLSMLYTPSWNGLVEGPTWDAWWIQNSYGTTYTALPLLQEPYLTFLQNSQDLWFDQMGDGHRTGEHDWVAPDGCLCDAAKPGWIYYRQGDGRIDIHDWAMEMTAAGVVMQSELLLIAHDKEKTAHYLPKLERSMNFIESRRDPNNNLFLAGPAANLLAPSFAGYHKPDGTYGKSYLTGLSVTYIAALDRMIELEKFANHPNTAADYHHRRTTARQGLNQMTTPEGYFIMSLDPDGTKHGVYPSPVGSASADHSPIAGASYPRHSERSEESQPPDHQSPSPAAPPSNQLASSRNSLPPSPGTPGEGRGEGSAPRPATSPAPVSQHRYFESSPNHDAIAFRITDDAQSNKIYNKIASIPQLRPHAFILPNYPSYDDMYQPPQGLWSYGTWVNGGHWSTCEARMMLAYARLNKFDDQKASFRQLLKFANTWRMDNPLTHFGDAVYQLNQPINLCYDTLGPASALRRGLFEYLYHADSLTLIPHIPPTLTSLDQLDPARFGPKQLYLSTRGAGPITSLLVNGQPWHTFDPTQIHLPYDRLPNQAHIQILLGNAPADPTPAETLTPPTPLQSPFPPELQPLRPRLARVAHLATWLSQNNLSTSYEFAHAHLIAQAVAATRERWLLRSEGKLPPLPPPSQSAADASYIQTVTNLLVGFEQTLNHYKDSPDPTHQRIYANW